MSEQAPPTFALIHGSWHNNWCMSLLQQELDVQGFKSIAPDLPISDPTKNFDDYAKVIVDDLQSEDHVIGVFHSRAGNYGPRAVNLLNNTETGRKVVRKMIFLAGSFEDSTIHALNRPAKGERVPARNTRASKQAIMPRP